MALILLMIAAVGFTVFTVLVGLWIILTVFRVLLLIFMGLLKIGIWFAERKNPAPVTMPEGPAHEAKIIDLKDDEWHYVS
jgi:hypothetical protein